MSGPVARSAAAAQNIKVVDRQVDDAGELDLELGRAVGVGAAADDRVAARGEKADLPGSG